VRAGKSSTNPASVSAFHNRFYHVWSYCRTVSKSNHGFKTQTKVDALSKNTDFIAIGVNRGDAFFVQKGERKVLVDGGDSRVVFPQTFLHVTRRTDVNALICTHSDSDHARGLLGFLQDKRLFAKEVWLPASWMDRLSDILQRPEDFLKELIAGIQKLDRPSVSSLPNLGDSYAIEENRKVDKDVIVEEKDVLESSKEANVEWSFLNWFLASHGIKTLDNSVALSAIRPLDSRLRLLREAITTSDLIRQIVLAAYRSGAKIRWFDYVGNSAQNASGGIPGFLVPVNAVEVTAIRHPKRTALKEIALTLSNKQSLVFVLPEDNISSGVLFTADSDLSFSQAVAWHDRMVITSPHHGAESNKPAYQKFQQQSAGEMDVVWVRSDEKVIYRPGESYLHTKGRKYCTVCRNYSAKKQNVRMAFSQITCVWEPVRTRECQCT
jgi:hypothetical protein